MKKPSHRELLFEMASLLVVFTAAFLVGEFTTSRTGSVWWGMSAGSLAFLGVIYTMILLVNRACPPSPDKARLSTPQTEPAEAGASPGAGEVAGFLLIFMVAYCGGHSVASWTGHVRWGILAGSLAVVGIMVALVRISRRLSAMQSTPAPSSFDKELAWAEPRDFRMADLKDTRKWVLNMIGLTLGVTVVFMGIANWYGLEAEVTRKLLVNAGGIVVLFLGLFGFTRLMRIVVKITDKAIVREFGETPAVYRFGTIAHCELGSILVGSKTYSVLVVALKNGDREILCVDPSVFPQVLRSTLEQRGVNVVTRTDTMSEQALASEDADPYPKLAGIQRNGNRRD